MPRHALRAWFLPGALVLLTLVVYAQVRNHPFINLDDGAYVVENRHVAPGITLEGLTWAFTSAHSGNWHPLTWISHMVDVELFGLDAGRHHLVSLFLHILNTLLLFAVFTRMTGAVWPSAFVAALFAAHPTHVESVAWIAERKDVLSGFFWMLTLLAYARYAASPSAWRYAAVLAAFIAGLMSKPMLVTLPFVLLLLDAWPLGRFRRMPVRRLAIEKLPLIACAIASSVVTFLVQRDAGAVKSLETLDLASRAAGVLVSYLEYLGKTFWPADLALLYPHVAHPPWLVAGAALVLAGCTVAAAFAWKTMPFVTVGWFWFLGTLVPVIGLVQVGAQRIADRYLYLPSIGLFIVIAWGAPMLLRGRLGARALAAAAAVVVSASAVLAYRQTGRWHSSESIWQHTLAVTDANAYAHNYLGHALAAAGRRDAAIAEFERALAIHAEYPEALNNLGTARAHRGELEEAIHAFRRALARVPHLPHARANLASALASSGRTEEALEQFTIVVRENPADAVARRHRAVALATLRRYDEAIAECAEALRLDPGDALAHHVMGAALGASGRDAEAAAHYAEAVRLDPRLWEARGNFGRTLIRLGRGAEGSQVLYELAEDLVRQGRTVEALDHLEALLRYQPDHPAGRQMLFDLAARHRLGSR